MSGANRGIGLHFVKVLTERNWTVYGTVRPQTRLDESFGDASIHLFVGEPFRGKLLTYLSFWKQERPSWTWTISPMRALPRQQQSMEINL